MILFTSGPRIEQPGFRWTPASLDALVIDFLTDLKPAVRDASGLVVEFESIRLHSRPGWGRRFRRSRYWTEQLDKRTAAGHGTCSWLVEVEEHNKPNALYCASFLINNSEAPTVSNTDSLTVILHQAFESTQITREGSLWLCRRRKAECFLPSTKRVYIGHV